MCVNTANQSSGIWRNVILISDILKSVWHISLRLYFWRQLKQHYTEMDQLVTSGFGNKLCCICTLAHETQ